MENYILSSQWTLTGNIYSWLIALLLVITEQLQFNPSTCFSQTFSHYWRIIDHRWQLFICQTFRPIWVYSLFRSLVGHLDLFRRKRRHKGLLSYFESTAITMLIFIPNFYNQIFTLFLANLPFLPQDLNLLIYFISS